MKNIFYLLVLFSASLHAQGWQKIYGKKAIQYSGNIAVQDYDKGFLIATNANVPPYNSLLIKTDINGNILWERYSIKRIMIDVIIPCADGSMLLGCNNLETDTTNYPLVVKMNACGDTIWSTSIYNCCPADGELFELCQQSNGDILARCDNYTGQPSILFCLDSLGKFKWNFGDSMYMSHILLDSNSNILISGFKYVNDFDNDTVKIIHSTVDYINSSGKKIWSYIYGRDIDKYGADGIGFTAPHHGFTSIHINYDLNFLKEGNFLMLNFDSTGKRTSVKYFGDTTQYEGAYDGIALNDSTYIMVGAVSKNIYGDTSSLLIMKVNSSGKVLKRKYFFHGIGSYAYTIRKTNDRKYIVCGDVLDSFNNFNAYVLKITEDMELDTFYMHSKYSYNYLCKQKRDSSDTLFFQHNYTIVKIDTMDFYTSTESISAPAAPGIKIYPNPFTNSTNISYTLNAYSSVKIEVYDLMGRRLSTLVDQAQCEGEDTVQFDAGPSIPTGMYMVRVSMGNTVVTKQVMVLR